MQRNDYVIEALGPGEYNDLLMQYYLDGGATIPTLPDAAEEFLTARGADPGNVLDMWMQYLGTLGYTGAYSDRIYEYWAALAGANLWVSPTIEAPWADLGSNTYSIDGSQVADKSLSISSTVGESYELSVIASSVSVAGCSVEFGTNTVGNITQDGSYVYSGINTSTTLIKLVASPGFIGTVKVRYVKQISV